MRRKLPYLEYHGIKWEFQTKDSLLRSEMWTLLFTLIFCASFGLVHASYRNLCAPTSPLAPL